MPNSSRLFFALWPDDETRQTLASLYPIIGVTEFKWLRPDNLHVTLVFLGQVSPDTESSLKQAAASITAQPFVLTFDSLNYWSKPKILCLACAQPAQEDSARMLVSALELAAKNCSLHTDPRPYIPHITLARHVRYLPEVKIEPIIWRAEAFCLVKSCSEQDGVCYKVLQQWPFMKPTIISE